MWSFFRRMLTYQWGDIYARRWRGVLTGRLLRLLGKVRRHHTPSLRLTNPGCRFGLPPLEHYMQLLVRSAIGKLQRTKRLQFYYTSHALHFYFSTQSPQTFLKCLWYAIDATINASGMHAPLLRLTDHPAAWRKIRVKTLVSSARDRTLRDLQRCHIRHVCHIFNGVERSCRLSAT